MSLSTWHLRFTLEAETKVVLGQAGGSRLRGALYQALIDESCDASGQHHDPQQADRCPVCRLMAKERVDWVRGKDVPRPFILQAPLGTGLYHPGQRFSFCVTLLGDMIAAFPYIGRAVVTMGVSGIGKGRGTFSLRRIEAIHPITGASEVLMDGGDIRQVRRPTLVVQPQDVSADAQCLPTNRIVLRFLSPTTLIAENQICEHPRFDALIGRLLERQQFCAIEYGGLDESELPNRVEIVDAARYVRLVSDKTQWIRVSSKSARPKKGSAHRDLSGFVGIAEYQGDLAPFRETLVWGQLIQVGKNAVKGNGLYEIVRGWSSWLQTPV